MIRLTLLTLAVLFAVMALFGEPGARPEPEPDAQAQAPETAAEPEPQPESQAAPAADPIVEVTAQTPERVQAFPGPELRPSPEHADRAGTTAEGQGQGQDAAKGAATLYVTGNRVNFRAGPSTGDAVIGALDGGSAVERLGEAGGGGWINIRDAQGRTGYMSADFLSPDRP